MHICLSETSTLDWELSGQLSRDPAIQSPIKIQFLIIAGCITVRLATPSSEDSRLNNWLKGRWRTAFNNLGSRYNQYVLLYNKGHNLHTWFQFLKSSNTQKEDLGGTQVGNDHVSRTRIKKFQLLFLRIIPINYLSWKVREPN